MKGQEPVWRLSAVSQKGMSSAGMAGDHSRVERTFGPDFELDGAPMGARDAWDAKGARDVG